MALPNNDDGSSGVVGDVQLGRLPADTTVADEITNEEWAGGWR